MHLLGSLQLCSRLLQYCSVFAVGVGCRLWRPERRGRRVESQIVKRTVLRTCRPLHPQEEARDQDLACCQHCTIFVAFGARHYDSLPCRAGRACICPLLARTQLLLDFHQRAHASRRLRGARGRKKEGVGCRVSSRGQLNQ